MIRPDRLLFALALDLLDLYAPRRCAACAEPHPAHPPRAPALCAACAFALEPAEDPPAGVIAPYAHGGPLARAIHRAKYGAEPYIARQLGALLAHAARPSLPAYDRVLPVPLHPRRLAARGYNQAAEIARALGARVVHGAVVRTRDTASQVTLGRAGRHVNVTGAFAARSPRALAGARVLVVDDVVTTGATLADAARAAREAGAREVYCVALARAPLTK